jgi:transcriptional repressor NrdR
VVFLPALPPPPGPGTAPDVILARVHCPSCHAEDTKVVDSRLAEEGSAVRRRRQCLSCAHRFTTFERVDEVPLVVVKADGHHEPFDRTKIVTGIAAATKGRGVEQATIEQIAVSIEDSLRLQGSEVSSAQIGLAVLDRLRTVDEVAYLRFASVYKNFDAAADFHREIELLGKLGAGG